MPRAMRMRPTTCVLLACGLVLGLFGADASAQKSRRKATSKTTRSKSTKGKADKPELAGSIAQTVKDIDEQISQGWKDNEIEPSERADDAEWIRRVYLDIVGHIPPAEDIGKFLVDEDPSKREKLINRLLEDPAYARNMTTIWTNLSIGRRNIRRVSRNGMRKFYREAFTRNQPWKDVVYDLMSAEGHFERNGAVNYWLAQMQDRDEMVQATAKTARLFLALQVQCTQCHNHPFNDWKQNQFWQFNSFFRQMQKVEHRKYNPKTGRQDDDYSEIIRRDFTGPVNFEKRSGLAVVAYPTYFGIEVDPGGETDRRKEFAKLVTQGDKPLIAQAMVNRTWGQFFGYGFTKPVDDLGPHNPPTHPDLMDLLSEEFVKSGYDVKQLIRWITNSEAYNLTSRYGEKNALDNPAAGESQLFSHMYVKGMQAEQLYDSLIVATGAHKSGRTSWDESEKQRRTWMQQFVVAFDTDEADESTTFNGTIPQALMMMNGDLTKDAISAERGGFLYRTLTAPGSSDTRRVRTLFLSTLGRQPTRRETLLTGRLMKEQKDDKAKLAAYQDLFWALLNSNEFIFNH